jgi:AhpD family alkylhydroperoxidase
LSRPSRAAGCAVFSGEIIFKKGNGPLTTNYIEYHKQLEERLVQLGRELPGPMSGFVRLHKKSVEDGALPARIKEMMAIAVSIAIGCDGCIAYHVHDAIGAGATRAELLETIGVGVMMGGGPGSIYAAHALDAIEQFLPQAELSVEPN